MRLGDVSALAMITRKGPQLIHGLYYLVEMVRLLCIRLASLLISTKTLVHKVPTTVEEDTEFERYPIWRSLDVVSKLTVALDLDETLVLTLLSHDIPGSMKQRTRNLNRFHLLCDNGMGRKQHLTVFLRPGIMEFLKKLTVFAEVMLYSAAVASYGNAVLDILDPNRRIFSKRFFRDSTIDVGDIRNVKDLNKLERDLRRTVIVDNQAFSFLLQPRNGIKCKPFRGHDNDRELQSIILPLLKYLSILNDVRPALHSVMGMEDWFKTKGVSFVSTIC